MTPFEKLEQKRAERRSAIKAVSIAQKQWLSILPDLQAKVASLDSDIANLEAETKAATDLVSRFSTPVEVNTNTTLVDLYGNKRKINADLAQYIDTTYWKQLEDLRSANEASKQALWSAQASESAIQNANLSKAGMSMQAWAESRNRNFLATQEAIANANNAFVNQENAVIDANLSKQLWLNQLNSADYDNYVREQYLLNRAATPATGVSNTAKYSGQSRLPNFSPQSWKKTGKDSSSSTESVPGKWAGESATNSNNTSSALENKARARTKKLFTDWQTYIDSLNPVTWSAALLRNQLMWTKVWDALMNLNKDYRNQQKKAAVPAAKASRTSNASSFFI